MSATRSPSASSARTTSVSASAPPSRRTATESGAAGTLSPKRSRTPRTRSPSAGSLGRHLEARPSDLGLQRGRGSLGDDPAVVDDPDPVGELVGLLEVLGGEEDGDPLLAGEAGDLVPERRPALRVEPGRRLVEEEDPGAVDEGEGEVEAPFHPARVAGDLAVGGVGEPDPLDQRVAAGDPLLARKAVQRRLQPHVVAGGQVRIEGRFLERGADRRPHRRAFADDVVAGDPGAAAGRRQQRRQHVDRRRLAGAVRAEEAVDLAGST